MRTADPSASTEALRDDYPDAIVTPGDADWDQARMSFNLVVDQHPDAVARPGSAEEGAAIVRLAREAGLRVHAQGSSHNPLGSLDGTLLVRFERMKDVSIDVDRRVARVEAGARWWDVVPQASEAGLSALHGSSPEINVVGYSLGGGIGWQGRARGLQANSVTAVEAVTADGEQVRADHDEHPDLFWALRGGSGNFAIVTAIEFALYPVDRLYAGAMFFGFEKAGEFLHTWREWTQTAPEEITTAARLMQFPPLEEVPEIVRGKAFAILDGAFLGTEEDGAELLRPFRELGPEMGGFAMVPPAALSDMHMDPVDPIPYRSAHALLDEISESTMDEAVAVAKDGPIPIFELRHTGGALGRAPEGAGAIGSLRGEYLMFGGVPVMDPSQLAAVEEGVAALDSVFAPHRVGRYLNFTEQVADMETMFPPGTLARLHEVKASYDPDDVIRGNHQLNGG